MNEQSEQDKQAQENIEALKLRASFLICQLARRPYAASLLSKAIKYLEMALNYKSDRIQKRRARQPQKTYSAADFWDD